MKNLTSRANRSSLMRVSVIALTLAFVLQPIANAYQYPNTIKPNLATKIFIAAKGNNVSGANLISGSTTATSNVVNQCGPDTHDTKTIAVTVTGSGSVSDGTTSISAPSGTIVIPSGSCPVISFYDGAGYALDSFTVSHNGAIVYTSTTSTHSFDFATDLSSAGFNAVQGVQDNTYAINAIYLIIPRTFTFGTFTHGNVSATNNVSGSHASSGTHTSDGTASVVFDTNYEDVVSLAATPSAGYVFTNWTCASTPGNFTSTALTSASATLDHILGDVTCTPVFTPIYTVTYNSTTSKGTAVTTGSAPVDASSPYLSGTVVTLKGNTASLALTGYNFVGWCPTNTESTPTTCTGGIKLPASTFSISGNMNFYSVWAPIPAPPAPVVYVNAPALNPVFDTPVSTDTGFTVNVTNYDPNFTWNFAVNHGAVAQGTADGIKLPLTVTGLDPEQLATITANTSRGGYDNGANTVDGKALAVVVQPVVLPQTPKIIIKTLDSYTKTAVPFASVKLSYTITDTTFKTTEVSIKHDAGSTVRFADGVVDSVSGKLNLKVTDQGFSVTSANGWTGRLAVPVIAVQNNEEVELFVGITENPGVVLNPTFNLNNLNKEVLSWKNDGSQAESIVVTNGNKVICSGVISSCTFKNSFQSKIDIKIQVRGHDLTISDAVAPAIIAPKTFTAHFASGSSVLTAADQAALKNFVRLAQILGTTTIKLTGHTDSTGSKTANVNLARLRAASIKTYLSKFLKKINYKIAVAADNAPVASNKNAAGQAANRRVEITLE